MTVEQIYTLMNNVTSEILGKSDIVAEDLHNVVDVGKEIFDNTNVDNYVKSLVNHIGKVIFVNRPYTGNVPSILMDSWEYGSVLEKISAELPDAVENADWQLENGKSYPTDVFYQPKVSAKFFNSKVTFEINMSFTEMQVKESFSSASELNGFLSMLYNSVEKAMTIKIDSLIMRTINNMIAQTFYSEFASVTDGNYSASTGLKAVNLLKLYNDKFGTAITAENAMSTPEFIRFASFEIGLYKDRLSKISTLFNIGGKERFTPTANLHTVMLSDFVNASKIYLESDTYHNDMVALPNTETVPYWQASGKDYSFGHVSEIHVNTNNGTDSNGVEITATGILAVMFDSDSCGVCNTDRRVTTSYNPKAEFYSNYYKFDASYFNDTNENFIVFFVA